MFRTKRFKEFCNWRPIKHIECPLRDYRGTRKVEQMIKTISERLRTKKQLAVKQYNSGLSEFLFCLRMYKKCTGMVPNAIKKLVIIFNPLTVYPESPKFELTEPESKSRQDSTILVRKSARRSNLEEAYKERGKGVLLEQTSHNMTFLSTGNVKQRSCINGILDAISKINHDTRGREKIIGKLHRSNYGERAANTKQKRTTE